MNGGEARRVVASDAPCPVPPVVFRILGNLEVGDGTGSVDLRRGKPCAVLTMLLLHPGQVVSTDRLMEALWGDTPPATATNTLQGYVSRLRQALPAGLIRTHPTGYALEVDADCIDAHRFERLAGEGRRALEAGDPKRAARLLCDALALWRGPALADAAYEAFASNHAARLEELKLAATEDQVDAELALGHHSGLVGQLKTLLEDHPLRERLWGQLMLALYRCGRQAEALRAFQAAKRTLGEELGIEPNRALRRLEGDILAQAPALEWQDTDPPSSEAIRIPFPGLLAARPSTGYVGRHELLARVTEVRRRAAAGTCRAVLLAGEPGVGKTRTAAETAQAAFAEGADVLYGHCDEGLGVPYQPFVEALDWYVTHAVDPILGRHAAELVRLHPLLPSKVPDLGPPVSSDPRSEEHLLFQATSSWLIEMARGRPLVLVLDDLHWASRAVLLLLRHVLRSAAGEGEQASLLVLGTYRDTEVDASHPLAELVADLRRLAIVDRIALAGLSRPEAEEFVRSAVGHELDGDTRALAETLHTETDGNPFFMHEVLRHLVETGAVHGQAGAAAVPESVRDVVARRIGRLPVGAQELLPLAAVLGPAFDVELLAALSDLPEEDLLDALDEARRARLVEETGPDRYRFSHALVRATLAGEMSATRRRRLHRRVADIVEKMRPDDVVALAFHLVESGPDGAEIPRAVRASLAAAEQALRARALADAEARFRQTLEILGRSAGADTTASEAADARSTEWARALCGLGEAQRDQGQPEFRDTLLEAARRAEQSGDRALLVRATLSNSRGLPSVIGGIDEERVAITEHTLSLVGAAPGAARARLLAQLAAEVSFSRDDRRRLHFADEAERMARALGDDDLLADVLNRTGYAAFQADRVERLVARAEEATRLADAAGDPSQRVLGRYFLSGALLTAGRVRAFQTVTEEMGTVARDAAPTLQWLALATQARLRVIDGDSQGVQLINDQAFQMAQELGEPDGPAWWAATLCPLEWLRGRFSRMEDVLRSGVTQYPHEQAWRIGYALALAYRDQRAEVYAVLEPDPPRIEELVDHVFPFFNILMVAYIAFHLDDAVMAARTAETLVPYGHCWAHQYAATIGPVSIGQALCAAVTGDLDTAVTHCEETERVLTEFGGRLLLPLFRTYYAEILYRRGRAPDRTLAGDLLDRVCEDALAIDAPELVERAHAVREGR